MTPGPERMETMSDPRLLRTLDRLAADGLISADPAVVRMLTGHHADIETGPSVFALPALVVATRDGDPVLVACADDAEPTETCVTYEGFTVAPITRAANARRALHEAIARTAGDRAAWAIDGATVPAGVLGALPGGRPADDALGGLTAIKTADDLTAVAAAVAVCDAGQAAAREATLAGADELDLWEHIRHAMERRAGGRIPIMADCVAGARAAQVGGPPSPVAIHGGEALLIDLVPRVAGIWADSCATFVDGEPPDTLRRVHAAARAALDAGLAMLRPGTMSGDIDAAVRAVMADDGWEYPHHTGHGVGFAWHEEPRIVPGGATVLEEGMVVALEPGAYGPDWGLRVEQVAVVTTGGPRVLSGHALSLRRAPG